MPRAGLSLLLALIPLSAIPSAMPHAENASPGSADDACDFADRLLSWYDINARDLPWRVPPPAKQQTPVNSLPDPYRVWLSEIMLQQTTVATVKDYFRKFLALWPTVADLAAAPQDEVLQAWAGLGYYARARNLHKCAQAIIRDHHGRFPDTEAALLTLPGIGPYTAAAIAAIAFDRRAAAVDGNVERVLARQICLDQPPKEARAVVTAEAARRLPEHRCGDYTQALMDLGATVCRPKTPLCGVCPVSAGCGAFETGTTDRYPVKPAKKAKPVRYTVAFWIQDQHGNVLVRRRADKGLLGGMDELPSTDWSVKTADSWPDDLQPPAGRIIRMPPGEVKHIFTHFELRVRVAICEASEKTLPEACRFVPADTFAGCAIPTAVQKMINHVRDDLDRLPL